MWFCSLERQKRERGLERRRRKEKQLFLVKVCGLLREAAAAEKCWLYIARSK